MLTRDTAVWKPALVSCPRLRIQYIRIVAVYRMSQEERSIFREVIVSVILSKKQYMYMCPIPKGFRNRATSQYIQNCLIRKTCYVLFIIQLFIVEVTKLVQFT
jgi:hypothetical protein